MAVVTESNPESPAPPAQSGRSWARAFQDIAQGLAARELWGHLGWQDLKQRYRRSLIGPLWISLGMAVTAGGIGLLYSQLLRTSIATFLPYVVVGFIVWNVILGCLTEGADSFIANESLIKHLPAPLTVYALRTVWRLTLILLHNMVVYLVVVLIFYKHLAEPYTLTAGGVEQPGLSWTVLLAIPAYVLIALNGVWVALLFGAISTRFRDIPQVIAAATTLLFHMTPITWSTDVLTRRFEKGGQWVVLAAELNPAYHFIQLMRAPLLGLRQSWHHWAVVGAVTVVGWALALIAMRNYRARISYWV